MGTMLVSENTDMAPPDLRKSEYPENNLENNPENNP